MSTLVGKKAIDFTTPAVLANGEIHEKFNFAKEIEGKYGVLFFYPLNFTFVCPSELISLSNSMEEFKKRGATVIGASVDSHHSHLAWRNTDLDSGGIGHINFALASDVKHEISQAYGIEHPGAGVALRAAFIIDKNGVVRSQIVNDLPIGRNVSEILRVIDAIEFHEQNGLVCPMNWNKGDKGMTPTSDGVATYLAENKQNL